MDPNESDESSVMDYDGVWEVLDKSPILGEFEEWHDASSYSKNTPEARSGHCCYTDGDYFYVVGGYTRKHSGNIFRGFWAFNILTKQWQRYKVDELFPYELASFSLCQVEPYSKDILLFGGSGAGFGYESSNKLYYLKVDNKEAKVQTHELSLDFVEMPKKYGQAMTRGESFGVFYIIGGTTGQEFNMDIHKLTFINDGSDFLNGTWMCQLLRPRPLIEPLIGRYKFGATYDEKRECLWLLGGGNGNVIIGFHSIDVFDIKTNSFKKQLTSPDDSGNFPKPRRCHSLVRIGRELIMTGGLLDKYASIIDNFPGSAEITEDEQSLDDTWILNLDTLQWRKHPHDLVYPVFFHDAAITPDGCYMVFGGVLDEPSSTRSNLLQAAYLKPPLLRNIAFDVCLNLKDLNLEFLDGFDLRYSDGVRSFFNRCLKFEDEVDRNIRHMEAKLTVSLRENGTDYEFNNSGELMENRE